MSRLGDGRGDGDGDGWRWVRDCMGLGWCGGVPYDYGPTLNMGGYLIDPLARAV